MGALKPDGGGWRGVIPDDWLQGRTSYGGLSAAIALHCAMRVGEDLPPLRSAQVAFVGPLAGEVRVTARTLRRGRNATFVSAEIEGEVGLGLRCTFVFMRATGSTLDHRRTPTRECARLAHGERTFTGVPGVPFTRNFEFVDRGGDAETDTAEWLRWTRLVEREGLQPMVELLAVGDCLPSAALRLMNRAVPLSSLTWMVNVLDPAPATDDGWWLLRARTDHVREGSSSQSMGVWNAGGAMVAEHVQSVALFG